MERVLVVGATGNIGIAAVIGALRSRREVLAIVRNQTSADKLFTQVGSREGIITAEADVTSEDGVQRVVDRVEKGELPAFQHVYSTVGSWNPTTPLHTLDAAGYNKTMKVNALSNFAAYRATIPYLLKQNHPKATWTLMTGGAGELGVGGVTAISQGALFSMANVACAELKDTNVRFNEVYLNLRVDSSNPKAVSSEDFAENYRELLKREDVGQSRVSVLKREDITNLDARNKLG